MSRREAEFLERLRATFLVEAGDHLQAIASGLLVLERTSSVAERGQQLEVVFRHTHSLKGAARAAGFPRIEAICQAIEEVFALCKRRGRILGADDFDVLHRAFDFVRSCVDADGNVPAGSSSDATSALVRQLQGISATDAPDERGGKQARHESPRGVSAPEQVPGDLVPGAEPAGELPDTASDAVPQQRVPTESVRVAAPRLDRVLLGAEELLTLRQANAERSSELHRLQTVFDDWGKQWLAVQAAIRRLRNASVVANPGNDRADGSMQVLEFLDWSHGYVRSLEGRVRALGRAAARDSHLASRQIDELLEHSKGLLLTPFTAASEGLPRLARDLAREQGKHVELQLEGAGVHLDKRIIEALKDPLVHLVRNAIDHGIETPANRRAAGKPKLATLRVEARLVHGNNVLVEVADDGTGLDPQRLRKAAVRAGLVGEEAAAELDDSRALDLAFRSDVSTSPMITEISGRGLGLAIVREHVERLGGRISVESVPGAGALFRIVLPQSLATLRGLFVEAGGERFVIPTAHVRRVASFPGEALKTVSRRQTLSIDGRTVAVSRLHDLLGLPAGAAAGGHRSVTVVIVGSNQDELALAVDEILEDEEVLVRRLRRPLLRVRNIAGATVLASGKVVPILNIADLLKSAARPTTAPAASVSTPAPRPDAAPVKVLLAEDSITSRLLLKGILESAGCEVRTVADGIEAFTALRSEPFDLLVSDIEMPRLNGFDLTARVRADRTLSELPVVLVTALARREDRERGIDVGANAYITKGGFDQRDLLDAIRRLVPGARR